MFLEDMEVNDNGNQKEVQKPEFDTGKFFFIECKVKLSFSLLIILILEDKYKPEGLVRLDITRFSDFARGLPAENAQRLSEPVYIRGMPWKILAIPRDGSRSPNRQSGKCLGFFLQCNGDSADQDNWSCTANAMLRIVPAQEGVEPNTRRITHTFHPKENDWGYSQFVQCDILLDDSNGYIKDDTVRLEVDVSADAPHGVQ